jgi:anti-sigma factor RsiW
VIACVEVEALLAERASGELAPEDAARLEEHLPGCKRCRAELAAYEDVFALVRAPGLVPLPLEGGGPGRGLADLATSTLAAWKLRQRQRRTAFALGAGFLAAAAAAVVALSPALLGHRAPQAAPAVAAAWEPDVDGAVQAASLLYPETDTSDATTTDTSTTDAITTEDVVLAALDEVDEQ